MYKEFGKEAGRVNQGVNTPDKQKMPAFMGESDPNIVRKIEMLAWHQCQPPRGGAG